MKTARKMMIGASAAGGLYVGLSALFPQKLEEYVFVSDKDYMRNLEAVVMKRDILGLELSSLSLTSYDPVKSEICTLRGTFLKISDSQKLIHSSLGCQAYKTGDAPEPISGIMRQGAAAMNP